MKDGTKVTYDRCLLASAGAPREFYVLDSSKISYGLRDRINTMTTLQDFVELDTVLGSDIDQSISREAFVLPHPVEGTISASTVALSNGDLALVEVQAVQTVEAPANPQITQQQTSQLAQSAYKSYVDSLKIGAKITRNTVSEPTTAY